MPRRFVLLAALLLTAGACASPRTDQSAKLAPLVGVNEAQLVAGMGRMPDLTEQPAPGVSLLQWRWRRSFTVPYNVLPYQYGGGVGPAAGPDRHRHRPRTMPRSNGLSSKASPGATAWSATPAPRRRE